MTTSSNIHTVMIPRKQIRVREERNFRLARSTKKQQELVASIKEHGQLEALGVVATGEEDFLYELDYGYGRYLALTELGKTDILCNVREHKGSKQAIALARMADNWTENIVRADVSYIDQAVFIASLVNGTYFVEEGEEAKPVSKEDIVEKFGLNLPRINALLRVVKTVGPQSCDVARKIDAPVALIMQLTTVKGEGGDRDQDQLALLEVWAKEQQELKSQGRKRREREDKGEKRGKNGKGKKGKEEKTGVVSGTRKVDYAVHKAEEDKSFSWDEYITTVHAKQESLAEEKGADAREQHLIMKGIEIGLRFAKGDLKKLPLVKADFEVLYVQEPEVEEASEEAAE